MKASFRDKRYTIPVLSVDLFEKIHETPLWSFSQLILREYTGGLKVGDQFSGAFTFDRYDSFGLFEAKVVKQDPNRHMLGAELVWVSRPGFELMELMNNMRQPDQPGQGPAMRVTITYGTVNWSLTGMLLDKYFGELETAAVIRGMIRIEKATESGIFQATVIRNNKDRNTLALKFGELPPNTFELLENSMKKASA